MNIKYKGPETNTMMFPKIVGKLMPEGFEGYSIDFRCASATYCFPDEDSIVLPTHHANASIAGALNVATVQVCMRQA